MMASQRGFVLVASIWLTLIVLLLAGLFAVYASAQLEQARFAKQRLVSDLDAYATENTLRYLLAVNPRTRKGLEINDGEALIKLDGTVYKGFGDAQFSLGDHAAFIGLNSADNVHLQRLLAYKETSPLLSRQLMDALYDYVDKDEDVRLNGAESRHYKDGAAPANRLIKSVPELIQVKGWGKWLDDNPEVKYLDWFSPNWRSFINVNAMPEALFQPLLGLSDRDAELLINYRRNQPFQNIEAIENLLNQRYRLSDEYFTFLPTQDVRLRIFSAQNNKLSTILILYTPFSTSSPAEVAYRYQSERHFDTPKTARTVAAQYFNR